MSERVSAPRNAFIGVVSVWVLALLVSVLIGVLVEELDRAPWLVLGFAGIVVLSFAVQLWYGTAIGFIFRVSASILGALLVMGLISAGFGLAALLPA
ncbi:hypothetical protein [Microbacterium sp. NIBRBAC000506063]|uniref:hypothetical protein n=1 Tax=Microbacterium sp. NIBRBAC000506063 TaxID=2734618 RepID=UPI001BB6950E|nr:hypothetical protein [Microbacterium sp. NIBRBAC000506063]QTV80028.1 hypothetical protein KAE78_02520 [Microbacterium sp. NIBRBAC000506063]